jgi:arabinofuranosyltransferase
MIDRLVLSRDGTYRISWLITAVALAAVGAMVVEMHHFAWKIDDAYIAFVYARNWVRGNGVVFNVGERVEGYTCFLWVALSALGLWLGVAIEPWSTALAGLAAAGTVLVSWRLAADLAPPRLRPAAVTAAVLVGVYPALAWWTASGMETVLFTFLVTAAVWRHLRHGAASVLAPLCLALASMTRPEGLLLSGVLCLDAAWRGSPRHRARYLGVFLALFAPYYAWRYWYYDYPLPNTFYAKVGATPQQVERGIRYLRTFLVNGAGTYLALGAALAVSRRTAVVLLFLVLYVGAVVVLGGDAFNFHRFFLPIVPLLCVLAVAGLLQWTARSVPRHRVVGYVVCGLYAIGFLINCVPGLRAQQRDLQAARMMDAIGRLTCARVLAVTAPDDSIASGGVGLIKYCTDRRVIDILGLTDKHIAHQEIASIGSGFAGHEKYDSHYVLAQWPKYIVLPIDDGHRRAIAPVRDLWQQPLFKRWYIADTLGYLRVSHR